MARPSTTTEVSERYVEIARIEVDKLSLHSALLKPYAVFLDAAEKLGGRAEKQWGQTVIISIAKTAKELEEQLEVDQRRWDAAEQLWLRAVRAEDGDDLREWERNTVVEWAEREGKPNPFDVFAANDPDVAQIRRELGLTG
ncbi:MAG: hypothetical protein AB7G47_10185 [Mycolicibacterium sp.]|uniref:DUF7432 family protein n=1 Tax=Mycolicibacterium sp. TaxID=2320850 RepID=UPI003D0CC24B